ncbi:MAG: carbohydrate ABC transporter permease, partial [bacterium]
MSSTSSALVAPKSGRFRKKILPYLLSLPALLVCIGILIPFFTAVYYSMMRFRLNLPYLKGFIWFDNYINFLSDPAFWNTVQISLLYAFLTVGLELLLGLGIAVLLQQPSKFNNIVSVLLLLPLMTAPALASLMWKLMTNPNFGILSYLVSLLGFSDFKWASDPSTALLTVVLVDIWVYTPFIMILLLAGLRSLPKQPFEAAALDGVPQSFIFFRITLPMLMPYLLTATLFRLLESIQQFDIIYSMTQGGPGDQLMVFQVQAYLEFFQYTNVGRSTALLMVLWAITFAL